MTKLNT